MNCPNCQQTLEAGAAFCGNCGQPVAAAVSPIAQVAAVPSYALATAAQQAGEKPALLAVLLGTAGIAGALFMALLGLVLGVAGLIMGTIGRSGHRRGLSTAGLVLSSVAVAVSLGVWTYAIQHDPGLKHGVASSSSHNTAPSATSALGLSTPCYSADFINKLNVANAAGSCDMEAFNGATLSASTEAYKIYADISEAATPANFNAIAKAALEKDTKDSLPGFTTDTEQVTDFAGSPAYAINSSDKVHHVAVVEVAVFHKVAAGDNIFILAHVVSGSTTDLSTLEAQWQWK